MQDITEEVFSKKSIFLALAGLLFFAVLSVYMFYIGISEFITGVYFSESIIIVYKSLYYFFGGILFFFAGFFHIFFYRVFNFPSDGKLIKLTNIFLLIGFLSVFLVPQILHFSFDDYLKKQNYSVCEIKTSPTFRYTDYVYTQTPELCIKE